MAGCAVTTPALARVLPLLLLILAAYADMPSPVGESDGRGVGDAGRRFAACAKSLSGIATASPCTVDSMQWMLEEGRLHLQRQGIRGSSGDSGQVQLCLGVTGARADGTGNASAPWQRSVAVLPCQAMDQGQQWRMSTNAGSALDVGIRARHNYNSTASATTSGRRDDRAGGLVCFRNVAYSMCLGLYAGGTPGLTDCGSACVWQWQSGNTGYLSAGGNCLAHQPIINVTVSIDSEMAFDDSSPATCVPSGLLLVPRAELSLGSASLPA